MRSVNAAAIALLEEFEGFRDAAYQDENGVWTIGFGHTHGVKAGDTCSRAQALQWLGEDLASAENAVEHIITVPLTDNEFGALVCFTYNVGGSRLAQSSLAVKLNAGNYAAVPECLKAWVFINGKVSSGLQRRRAAEAALWSTP